MAVTSLVRNSTMGRITLVDGSASPVSLVLAFERGDFALSGIPSGGKLNEVVKNTRRGKLLSTARGERVFPSGSFSSWLTELGDSAGTVADFVSQRGAYSGNTGTRGAGEVYTCDVKIEFLAASFGAKNETFLVEDCTFVMDVAEAMEGNTLSFSFESLGRVLLDGVVFASEIS